MNQYEKQMLWCFGGGSPAIRYTRYALLSGLMGDGVVCGYVWAYAARVRNWGV